jgi:hypothetical protein
MEKVKAQYADVIPKHPERAVRNITGEGSDA